LGPPSNFFGRGTRPPIPTIIAAHGRQHRLPTTTLSVGSTTVAPVSSVCDLGIFVDSDLVMRTHVCRTVSSCFAALRQLHSIRHLVSATVFQSLVAALVLCRLDYGIMAHWSASRLHSVQNAAARLVFRLRRSDHITDALVSLHWLRVPEGITFKVAVLTYRALHGYAPQYLRQFTSIADIPSSTSTSYMFLLLDCLLLDVAPSLSPVLVYGTTYHNIT